MHTTAHDILPLSVLQRLAATWQAEGDLPRCALACRDIVERCKADFGPSSAQVAHALVNYSAVLYRQRDLDGAEALLQQAQGIWAAQRPLPPELGTCLNNLGRIAEERGNRAQGIALHRQAVALRRDMLGACHADTAFSVGNLGVALAANGQWREAADTLEAAVACYARLGKHDSPDAMAYKENLALCRRALGERDVPPAAVPPASFSAAVNFAHATAQPAAPTSAATATAIAAPAAAPVASFSSYSGAARSQPVAAPAAAIAPTSAATATAATAAPAAATAAPSQGRTALLTEIIERELTMFLSTPNEGGVASCQQQPEGFRIMRRMNFEALSDATLASYLEDLRRAAAQGRNFMIEKYARMDNRLPPLQNDPRIGDIVALESAFAQDLAARYPLVAPRPAGTGTTFAHYLRCELETLSPATLELYLTDLRRAVQQGYNPVQARYECLAVLLGKGSLDAMEASLRK